MDQLNFLDVGMITQISILVVALIQYIKPYIPTWIIKPYLQVAAGISFGFLIQRYLGQPLNYVAFIINGVLAAMVSEGGYQVLSSFGLKSKEK